jgi:hypothetical protein
MQTGLRAAAALALAGVVVIAGCSSPPARAPRPEDVRAQIESLLPPSVADRAGWAVDIQPRSLPSPSHRHRQRLRRPRDHEQESTYRADPAVPGLGRIARDEIDRRAERAAIPKCSSTRR